MTIKLAICKSLKISLLLYNCIEHQFCLQIHITPLNIWRCDLSPQAVLPTRPQMTWLVVEIATLATYQR